MFWSSALPKRWIRVTASVCPAGPLPPRAIASVLALAPIVKARDPAGVVIIYWFVSCGTAPREIVGADVSAASSASMNWFTLIGLVM